MNTILRQKMSQKNRNITLMTRMTGKVRPTVANRGCQHIRVTAVDSKGRRVSNAVADVTVKVDGEASVVAMSNGNIKSDELSVTNHQKLFNGSCLAILRSGQSPSPVTVTVSAPGFKTAKLKLSTK